ncbi:MAG TPA: hypothetical protein VHV83_14250 [Armatimonadota bacterium]|nr:hypothetical protein [Armatimonadota bacterium]
MRSLQFLAVTMCLLTTACIALAYPTLAGYTGTGVLPTALVPPAGQWDVAADFYNTENSGATGLLETSANSYPIRTVYGVSKNFEVGAGYAFSEVGEDDANTWNVNAKYQFAENFGFPWSIGARFAQTDLSASDTTVNTFNAYLVGSRIFPRKDPAQPLIIGSFGLNWTTQDADDTNDAFRVFGSASATFCNGLELAADVQAQSDDFDSDPLYSLVARYPLSNTTTMQVGFTNANPTFVSSQSEGNFFAGLNLSFDGAYEK